MESLKKEWQLKGYDAEYILSLERELLSQEPEMVIEAIKQFISKELKIDSDHASLTPYALRWRVCRANKIKLYINMNLRNLCRKKLASIFLNSIKEDLTIAIHDDLHDNLYDWEDPSYCIDLSSIKLLSKIIFSKHYPPKQGAIMCSLSQNIEEIQNKIALDFATHPSLSIIIKNALPNILSKDFILQAIYDAAVSNQKNIISIVDTHITQINKLFIELTTPSNNKIHQKINGPEDLLHLMISSSHTLYGLKRFRTALSQLVEITAQYDHTLMTILTFTSKSKISPHNGLHSALTSKIILELIEKKFLHLKGWANMLSSKSHYFCFLI